MELFCLYMDPSFLDNGKNVLILALTFPKATFKWPSPPREFQVMTKYNHQYWSSPAVQNLPHR
jgi:hypothetical protein